MDTCVWPFSALWWTTSAINNETSTILVLSYEYFSFFYYNMFRWMTLCSSIFPRFFFIPVGFFLETVIFFSMGPCINRNLFNLIREPLNYILYVILIYFGACANIISTWLQWKIQWLVCLQNVMYTLMLVQQTRWKRDGVKNFFTAKDKCF